MIAGGIVCVFNSLYWLSVELCVFSILYWLWVELCAFLVVKVIVYGIVCDQSFIMIVGEIVCTLSSL
jgi:hypothetical protein